VSLRETNLMNGYTIPSGKLPKENLSIIFLCSINKLRHILGQTKNIVCRSELCTHIKRNSHNIIVVEITGFDLYLGGVPSYDSRQIGMNDF
jgi:hypothetical protein